MEQSYFDESLLLVPWIALVLLCQIRHHFDAPRVSACFL